MKHKIRTEIIINASKEKVWSILADLNAYAVWNPFIVKSEGILKVGTKLRNTLQNGDKTIVFNPKVVEVAPNRSFGWLGSLWIKGLFDGHHYFEIEEISENQVNLIHGENFSGILSSLILKQIGNDTRNNFVKMNQALKSRAEQLGVKR